MKRKLINELLNWKKNKRTKPLMIYGARQVGKTYLVREFAKDNYEYLYEINFELDKNGNIIEVENEKAKKAELTQNCRKGCTGCGINVNFKEGKCFEGAIHN